MEGSDFTCITCSNSLNEGDQVVVVEECQHLLHEGCSGNTSGTCPVDEQVFDVDALCSTSAVPLPQSMASRFNRLMFDKTNTHSQRNIAWIFSNERGDEEKAVRWLQKAVDGIDPSPNALLDLAERHRTGKSSILNQETADRYRRTAMSQIESLQRKNAEYLGTPILENNGEGEAAVADSVHPVMPAAATEVQEQDASAELLKEATDESLEASPQGGIDDFSSEATPSEMIEAVVVPDAATDVQDHDASEELRKEGTDEPLEASPQGGIDDSSSPLDTIEAAVVPAVETEVQEQDASEELRKEGIDEPLEASPQGGIDDSLSEATPLETIEAVVVPDAATEVQDQDASEELRKEGTEEPMEASLQGGIDDSLSEATPSEMIEAVVVPAAAIEAHDQDASEELRKEGIDEPLGASLEGGIDDFSSEATPSELIEAVDVPAAEIEVQEKDASEELRKEGIDEPLEASPQGGIDDALSEATPSELIEAVDVPAAATVVQEHDASEELRKEGVDEPLEASPQGGIDYSLSEATPLETIEAVAVLAAATEAQDQEPLEASPQGAIDDSLPEATPSETIEAVVVPAAATEVQDQEPLEASPQGGIDDSLPEATPSETIELVVLPAAATEVQDQESLEAVPQGGIDDSLSEATPSELIEAVVVPVGVVVPAGVAGPSPNITDTNENLAKLTNVQDQNESEKLPNESPETSRKELPQKGFDLVSSEMTPQEERMPSELTDAMSVPTGIVSASSTVHSPIEAATIEKRAERIAHEFASEATPSEMIEAVVLPADVESRSPIQADTNENLAELTTVLGQHELEKMQKEGPDTSREALPQKGFDLLSSETTPQEERMPSELTDAISIQTSIVPAGSTVHSPIEATAIESPAEIIAFKSEKLQNESTDPSEEALLPGEVDLASSESIAEEVAVPSDLTDVIATAMNELLTDSEKRPPLDAPVNENPSLRSDEAPGWKNEEETQQHSDVILDTPSFTRMSSMMKRIVSQAARPNLSPIEETPFEQTIERAYAQDEDETEALRNEERDLSQGAFPQGGLDPVSSDAAHQESKASVRITDAISSAMDDLLTDSASSPLDASRQEDKTSVKITDAIPSVMDELLTGPLVQAATRKDPLLKDPLLGPVEAEQGTQHQHRKKLSSRVLCCFGVR